MRSNLIAKAVEESGSTDRPRIIAYWNTLSKYPGYFGNYTFTPTEHNGYPTEEIVMSEASHRARTAPSSWRRATA